MTEDTDNPWPAYRLADARRDAKRLIHITVGEGRDAKFYSFTHRRDAEWFLKGVTACDREDYTWRDPEVDGEEG